MSSRVWLITGASSGFGYEMTRCALAHGDRVLATLRNPSTLAPLTSLHPPTQLLVSALDVTDPDGIRTAFARAQAAFGRVDVVFNNAGMVVAGEAEGVPDAAARRMFEVNFWGAAHVSQEAVRVFRDENVPRGGHLVQNIAAAGVVGYPTLGFYAASKHALEGLTKSLRMEMDPEWNIKITAIEAGGFKTSLGTSLEATPPHPAYASPSSAASRVRAALDPSSGSQASWPEPGRGVEKIYALTRLPAGVEPPLHFPLGTDAVQMVRGFMRALAEDLEGYASWSDDLVP